MEVLSRKEIDGEIKHGYPTHPQSQTKIVKIKNRMKMRREPKIENATTLLEPSGFV